MRFDTEMVKAEQKEERVKRIWMIAGVILLLIITFFYTKDIIKP